MCVLFYVFLPLLGLLGGRSGSEAANTVCGVLYHLDKRWAEGGQKVEGRCLLISLGRANEFGLLAGNRLKPNAMVLAKINFWFTAIGIGSMALSAVW